MQNSLRPCAKVRSHSAPMDPSCSATTWCARCSGTPASSYRRASAFQCRASRPDRSGTGSPNTLLNLDGAEHRRLRRLVAKAFTPRAAERMRGACVDVINRAGGQARGDGALRRRRRYRQAVSGSDHLCAAGRTALQDWKLFSQWTDDITKGFGMDVAAQTTAIVRGWEQLEAYIGRIIVTRRTSPWRRPDLRARFAPKTTATGSPTTSWSTSSAILLNAGTETTRNQLAAAVEASGRASGPVGVAWPSIPFRRKRSRSSCVTRRSCSPHYAWRPPTSD